MNRGREGRGGREKEEAEAPAPLGRDFPAVPGASRLHPPAAPRSVGPGRAPCPGAVSGGTPGAQHPLPGLSIPSPPGAHSLQRRGTLCSARVPSTRPAPASPSPPCPPHSLSPAASACSFAHMAHSICPMARSGAGRPERLRLLPAPLGSVRAPSATPGSARLGPGAFGCSRPAPVRLRSADPDPEGGRGVTTRRPRPLRIDHASFLTGHAPAGDPAPTRGHGTDPGPQHRPGNPAPTWGHGTDPGTRHRPGDTGHVG